jgi:hypothetical protein
MYGLCTGDFNRSFDPTLKNSGSSSLQLIYADSRKIGRNQEFDLPVHIGNASIIGAISLVLNFPGELVEVMDVIINGNNGQADWAVKGNELRIGWNSIMPIDLASVSNPIILRLKTTDAFREGAVIRFELASNPLNELADDEYSVIGDAFLIIDFIDATPLGIVENSGKNELALNNHPNPFDRNTIITYSLPFEGNVILEIRDILGKIVKILADERQTNGDHLIRYDAASLFPGIYTATIRLRNESDELIRTIRLVINRQ